MPGSGDVADDDRRPLRLEGGGLLHFTFAVLFGGKNPAQTIPIFHEKKNKSN